MLNNLKIAGLSLFIGIFGSLFAAQTVHADALNLSIDPPITVINAVAPATITSPLTIQNNSASEIALQIQFKPFKAKGENGEPEYLKGIPEFFSNIQVLDQDLPVENITLAPEQQKNLILKISIPEDTTISDYSFSVVFVSTNSAPTEMNSSVDQIGIATNVLLSIGPSEIPDAVLEEFSSPIFLETGPVSFTVRIKNNGIHFIQPKGEIIITNMYGQKIGKLDLIKTNILPDSIRAIPDNNYIQGISDFKNPTALWKEKILLGIYTATLNISMSDNGPIFTRTIHFLAFPFQGLIIFIIAIIVIIIFLNRIRKYTNKSRTQV